MSEQLLKEAMDQIREDLRKIKEHMNDHDLLIESYTVLKYVSSQLAVIEKNTTMKAEIKDVLATEERLSDATRILTIRVEAHDKELQGIRAYMNRVIGIALAFNTFMVIIFGLLSFIKR